FHGKDRPVRLEDSEDIVLRNCFFNSSLGMLVTGGFGHEFSGNWFWPGPGNFSDDSGSSWDDGENGNFWIALDLEDQDGDGISEDAVSVPGGSSKDRFPLVPGLDLSLIVPFEMTTGEEFQLTCRAIPRIFDLKRGLSLHCSNGTVETLIVLDPGELEQNVTFLAPSNSTDDLVFWLNASLVLGGYMESVRHTSRILDNDAPNITLVDHVEQAGNGSEVRFRLLVIDNIGIMNVWCHITQGYETEVVNLSRNGSYWDLVFITSREPCERYSIVFLANDTSGNRVFTSEMILRSFNSTFPFRFDEMTSNVTGTGDILTFSASISGIFTISSVGVEYTRGNESGTISAVNVSGVFSCDLDVEPDSVLPIEYRWCVTDLSGNGYYTYPFVTEVVDTIDPTIDPGPYPDEVGTGSVLNIEFGIEDNIEIGYISGEVTLNGEQVFSFSEEELVFSVPVNMTGDLVVSVDVSDPSGNVVNWTSDVIFIRDTLDPEITFTGNLSCMVNEVFRLQISATDNIGIAHINWSIGDIRGSGSMIEHVFEREGSYPIRMEVTDTSGNVAFHEDTVSVTLSDDDGDPSSDRDHNWIYVLIGVLSLVVLLIVIFFVTRMIRKEPVYREE
ncbi:MAG: PKD domain-containing protein, partial [Candidatus Thermoplasmatota archaeon]|nr:PKD domain-containing protein [Candidatus Thermoplasmatota archaeon]